MGKFSRNKGATYERKIATLLRERFPQFKEDIRRSVQSREAEESDVTGIPGLWLELQHAANPTPDAKLKQAIRDHPPGTKPIAITHKTRSKSTEVSMQLITLIQLYKLMVKKANPGIPASLLKVRVQLDLEPFLQLIDRGRPWEEYDEKVAKRGK